MNEQVNMAARYEHEIPEGYEARIEGNKVIIERKESEDEIIRNRIIGYLKQDIEEHPEREERIHEMLAYLERQKPIQDKEEKEYVRTLKSLIADFLRNKDEIDRGYYQKIYDWLDGKHIEQKPVNDRYMDGYVKGYADGLKNAEDSYNRGVSYHFDNPNIQRLDPNVVIESKTGGTYPDILEGALTGGKSIDDKDEIEVTPKQDYSGLTDLERAIHRGFLCAGVENVPVGIIKDTAHDCLAHIKPAEWIEEDEEKLSAVISLMITSRAVDPFYDKMCLEGWLKSLPERFNLQPKQEWREEDEKIRQSLINDLESAETEDEDVQKELNKQVAWLKSLRPSWKPSEEQIYSLGTVVKGYDNCTVGSVGYNLKELYQQLKKL